MQKTPPMFNIQDLQSATKELDKINKSIIQVTKKQFDETIKLNYKGMIQQSFLVKMKHFIMESNEFSKVYQKEYNPLNLPNGTMFDPQCDMQIVDEVAKTIAFVHEFNMYGIQNRNEYEDNKKYQEELKQKVIEELNYRRFGLAAAGNKINIGLYPPLYSFRVLLSFSSMIIDKFSIENYRDFDDEDRFIFDLISNIARRCNGIVDLFDDNCIDASYGICRQIIEFFLTYKILTAHPEGIESYKKFKGYAIEYNSTRKFPDEFIKLYESKFGKKGSVEKVNYLNYGWIDSITEFSYMEGKNYIIKELFDFVDLKCKVNKKLQKNGEIMYQHYRRCSLLSHGNNLYINPTTSSLEILEMIHPIFETIIRNLSNSNNLDFTYEGVDMLSYARKNIAESLDRIHSRIKEISDNR